MRILIACLFIIGAAQAVDWYKVRHIMPMREAHSPLPVTNGRIIGGSQATPGQFPYQVGLFIDGSGFCGGALIADNTVLTAAHCAVGSQFHEVHAGAQNIYNNAEPGRVLVTTFDHLVHENYNAFTLNNDLALIFLGESISGPNIGSVRLPSRSMAGDTLEGVTARSSGWGRPSDADPNINEELKFVDVTIITTAECAAVYGNIITDCNICISTAGGTAGVCNGDSGGPLTITEADGIVTEVGITSFVSSAGCGTIYPHGYCRISCYLDWIEANAPGITIRP